MAGSHGPLRGSGARSVLVPAGARSRRLDSLPAWGYCKRACPRTSSADLGTSSARCNTTLESERYEYDSYAELETENAELSSGTVARSPWTRSRSAGFSTSPTRAAAESSER
jgi:hypothetical protein